jgi:hypothetical protein
MFGVVTALTLLSLMVILPTYFRLKSHAKRIIALFIAETTANWILFLCVWVEQGFYESAAVFYLLLISIIFRGAVETTLVLSKPIYVLFSKNQSRLRNSLFIVEFVGEVFLVILTILLCVYCRWQDTNAFNSVMVIYQFIVSWTTTLLVFFTSISAIRLYRGIQTSIGDNINDPKMAEFYRRLKDMIKSNVSGSIFSLILYVFPIASVVLKSFPGQYIFFCIYHTVIPIFVTLGAINFKADEQAIANGPSDKRISRKITKNTNSKEEKAGVPSQVAVAVTGTVA